MSSATTSRPPSTDLSRRALGHALVAALAAACAAPARRAGTPSSTTARPRRSGRVELWSRFDLPREERTRELSAAAWDRTRGLLWSVQDETPSLVALRPSADLRSWSVAQTIAVTADGPLDLEGVAVLDDGFVVASEEGARVLELDARGVVRREHAVPQAFRSARANKGLESLALSPDGRALFTTSESALAEDGPVATARAGTLVRLLRIDRATGAATEHGYLTDAAVGDGCDHGVSDLAALSPSELLVLERGFCEGRGNRVRVYRVSLGEVPMKMRDGSTSSSRSGGELEALAKSLVVDLAALERPEAPLLANYEGIALGPPLPDGKASLLLVSDDNGHDAQAARVLVLALG